MESKVFGESVVLIETRYSRNVHLDCPSHRADADRKYTVVPLTRNQTAQNQKVRGVTPTWCSEARSEYWAWPISITIAIIRGLLSTDHILMQTFCTQHYSTYCPKADDCCSKPEVITQ